MTLFSQDISASASEELIHWDLFKMLIIKSVASYGIIRPQCVEVSGLVQDCSISIVDALELLQFCSQPSIYTSYLWKEHYLIKLRSYWTMSETVWEHRRHLSSLANTLHSMTQHIERKWVSCHLLCGKRLGAGNETCNTFVFLALVEPSKSYCVEVYRNTWGIYGWVRARKT